MPKKYEDKPAEENDEKIDKKKVREEKAEKRKKVKKQDKIAKWSGAILFLILMFVGFLVWVSGEVREESGVKRPVQTAPSTPTGRVIIE